MICKANQQTGFYMRATLVFNALNISHNIIIRNPKKFGTNNIVNIILTFCNTLKKFFNRSKYFIESLTSNFDCLKTGLLGSTYLDFLFLLKILNLCSVLFFYLFFFSFSFFIYWYCLRWWR